MWRVQNDSQIADWQMQVISALTNMLEEVCCSSRLAYKKKRKKKDHVYLRVHKTGKHHPKYDDLSESALSVLRLRKLLCWETNDDTFSGSKSLNQDLKQTSIQSKILWLSALSWISLSSCLVRSAALSSFFLSFSDSSPSVNSTFYRERERGASWSFFTTFVTSHAMRIFLPFILHYIKCDERIVTLHIGLED